MVQSRLSVRPRKRTGKSGARKVRKEGNIPAVLYGNGVEPTALVVEPEALRRALSNSAGRNTVLEIEIEGGEKRFSLLREIQKDPLGDRAIHIDFLAIDMEKPVRVSVPVNTNGRSEGERKGGKLEKLMRAIEIECLPSDIPDSVEIDVSDLDIGDSVDVAGVELGEGAAPLRGGDEKVVQVIAERAAAEEEEETEEEEAVEEAAEAAEE